MQSFGVDDKMRVDLWFCVHQTQFAVIPRLRFAGFSGAGEDRCEGAGPAARPEWGIHRAPGGQAAYRASRATPTRRRDVDRLLARASGLCSPGRASLAQDVGARASFADHVD